MAHRAMDHSVVATAARLEDAVWHPLVLTLLTLPQTGPGKQYLLLTNRADATL